MSDTENAEAEAGQQTPHAPGWSREQSIAWWQERGLPVDAQPVQCPYCSRFYLRPCDGENHARCMNFQHARRPAREDSQ